MRVLHQPRQDKPVPIGLALGLPQPTEIVNEANPPSYGRPW